MKIKCEICDSSLIKDSVHFVCENCGIKYTTDYVRSLLKEKVVVEETIVEEEKLEVLEELDIEEVTVCEEAVIDDASIEEEIDQNLHCPECGQLNEIDSIFCCDCGTKILIESDDLDEVLEDFIGEESLIISESEKINFEEEKLEVLEELVIEEPSVAETVVEEVTVCEEAVIEDASIEEEIEQKLYCPECGQPNELDAAFCCVCGLKINAEENVVELQPEMEVIEIEEQKNVQEKRQGKLKKFFSILFHKSEEPKAGEVVFDVIGKVFFISSLVLIFLAFLGRVSSFILSIESLGYLINNIHVDYAYITYIIARRSSYMLLYLSAGVLGILFMTVPKMKKSSFVGKMVFILFFICLNTLYFDILNGSPLSPSSDFKSIFFVNFWAFKVLKFIIGIFLYRRIFFIYSYCRRKTDYKLVEHDKKSIWDTLVLVSLFLMIIVSSIGSILITWDNWYMSSENLYQMSSSLASGVSYLYKMYQSNISLFNTLGIAIIVFILQLTKKNKTSFLYLGLLAVSGYEVLMKAFETIWEIIPLDVVTPYLEKEVMLVIASYIMMFVFALSAITFKIISKIFKSKKQNLVTTMVSEEELIVVEQECEQTKKKGKLKRLISVLFNNSEKPKVGEKVVNIIGKVFFISSLVIIFLAMVSSALSVLTYSTRLDYHEYYHHVYIYECIFYGHWFFVLLATFVMGVLFMTVPKMKKSPFVSKIVIILFFISINFVYYGAFNNVLFGFRSNFGSGNNNTLIFPDFGIYKLLYFIINIFMFRRLLFVYSYCRKKSNYKFVEPQRKSLWDKLILISLFSIFIINTLRTIITSGYWWYYYSINFDRYTGRYYNMPIEQLSIYYRNTIIGLNILFIGSILFIFQMFKKNKTSHLLMGLLAFEGYNVVRNIVLVSMPYYQNPPFLKVTTGITSLLSILFVLALITFIIIRKITNKKQQIPNELNFE